ncbi:HDOD domain-containing protein [Methylotuvimicrobium buryatense]|uniref:HDOD domain-containing protein n=1 Tax=Methylotuvimicrobium buryatense TaxID=95641 RepID=A0A4P9UQB5_METBY|nr:HDOD domain-containing protein [Methylotuvimicrobium buryatense]QCW83619.1 HDOD domain-containing protein [Methylotuvimicrobium buryatense]
MKKQDAEIKGEPRSLEDWTAVLRDREMPVFSDTVQSINYIIEDEKKGAMELAPVILQDPNLTAKLLKLSNSIYYNPSRKQMVTVSRAIVILGIEVIRELTLACSLFEAILSPNNRRRANEEIAKAIHAAVQAKALAIAAKDPSPEEVFIAALLKNIGSITFWCFCGAQGDRIQALLKNGLSNEAAEKQVLGFKLADLDISLCKTWNLKGLIEAAIKKSTRDVDPRVKFVRVGCEVVEALREGVGTQSYYACVEKIEAMTGLSKQAIEASLRKNTDIAANIACHFGATEASNLIQHNVRQNSEANASAQNVDRKMLQFQILQDITTILSGRIDINLLLETVLEGIQRGIGMDRTIFALLTKDKNALLEKVALGWRKDSYLQKIRFELSQSPPNLFFQAITNHEGYWVNPKENESLYSASDVKTIGKQPCLLMAVCSGDKPIGLIYCDRAYSNFELTEDDLKAFKHFVQQANIGLSLYRMQAR